MATLKDIAEATGVSVRTVTRALGENGYVKAELRDRIRGTAKNLGYMPDPIAQSLRLGRTREVVVIATTVDELHMARIAGLEHSLRDEHYITGMLMVRESDITSPDALIEELRRRRPAAVAIAARLGLQVQGLVAGLLRDGVKAVAIDTDVAVPAVRIDRSAGVAEAARYLLESGRRKIVYVGPVHSRERIDGYEQALGDAAIEPQIFTPPADRRQAISELFTRHPTIEAIQAYSDQWALELLAGLHDAGIRVPDDVALIGFDDRWAARFAWPALTTVAQPSRQVGAAAARFLADGQRQMCDEWIPARLVIRESA